MYTGPSSRKRRSGKGEPVHLGVLVVWRIGSGKTGAAFLWRSAGPPALFRSFKDLKQLTPT